MTGLIGRSVLRAENASLLTGAASFVADVDRDGQAWARIVRSPYPHAVLRGVDASAALAAPAVVTVITAADIPRLRIPIRIPFAETPEANGLLQAPLASDRVRYVGEPVAVVVAHDPYAVEDAAELVTLDVEELPVIGDVVEADGAPALVHPEHGSNVVNRVPLRYGDPDTAFDAADVIVRERLRVHRHTAVPLETRGLLAEWDANTERLTVWGAAKVKHFNLSVLAQMLDLQPEQIRFVELCVGGGFGVRGEFYPEDFLIPFLARRLDRPVKWIEDRAEHFVATNHSREQVHDVEIAAKADGTLVAFRDRAWCDQGAYVRTQGILPPLLPTMHLPGPYRWEAFAIESAGVLTNRTPVGTYRGPGVTEATYVRERMLDRVAHELSLDPVELRRRNLVPFEAMPFVYSFGEHDPPLVYDSGDFAGFFEELLRHARFDELRGEQARRRAAGELVGFGVAAFTEVGEVGPFEDARITVEPDGRFVVHVGIASVGQGIATTLAQIAAERLGVAFESITIDHHDTDTVPTGFGSFASRSTVLAGNAVALAADDLLAKAGGDGLAARASALAAAGTVGEGRFEKEHPSFSFGAAAALVTVDPETGEVTIERCLVACDVGRAVNPALVRGQLQGAAAQGIAAALFEELAYDESGQPLTISFVDYLMPSAADLPVVEPIVLEHPTPTNPLGIKGAGEAGMSGTPAAVANAVADALDEAGRNVTALPLNPTAVLAALADG